MLYQLTFQGILKKQNKTKKVCLFKMTVVML